jgi:acylphosphatase
MSTYRGQTGQVTKVKLDSAIEQVYWTRRQAAPEATVGLEIFTRYVGNNAELKIELTDNDGKSHGTFNDKLHGNHFWGPVKVPATVKGALFASVKLPGHGLSQKSPPLLVLPPVKINNVKWDRNQAKQGDVLKLSATVKNVPDGVEASLEIYEHDSVGAHELITKFPAAVNNERIEKDWEFQFHDHADISSPLLFFFRVSVADVTGNSGTIEFKKSQGKTGQ